MNKKIQIIFLVIIAMATIVVSFSYFLNKKTSSTPNANNNYDKLAVECDFKDSKNCCLSSVDAIIKGNYILEPTTGCPARTQRNMMKCESTLIWCEPITITL